MRPRAAARWLMALGLAVACGPGQLPGGPGPPVNACSVSPCNAYGPPGPAPSCTEGVCEVAIPLSSVIFIIDLAQDSFFAPGGTFVVPHDHLFDPPSKSPQTPCEQPSCGQLPAAGEVTGSYLMAPSAQSPPSAGSQGVGFYLGNDTSLPTALPVSASFSLLQDPWGDDVVAMGLPIEPVQAYPYEVAAAGASYPGPEGGPTLGFQAYLQAGMYERTLVPDSPFDAVFGPELRAVTVTATVSFDAETVFSFDVTTEEPTKGPTLPTFDISRADGLEGWSAYLRDATTLQTISNVRPLAGTLAQGVFFATRRPPPTSSAMQQDALSNAELVIAPPAGVPIPTGVFQPAGSPGLGLDLPAQETYPLLPQPVTLTGNIVSSNGTPVPADVVFEALAITDENGLNDTNFEFVGYASARPAATGGASTYSVVLPPGQYRVDVRPVDTTSAVTIADVLVDEAPVLVQTDFTVGAMTVIQGTATISDQRLLSGATVEALPTQCFTPAAAADADAGGTAMAPGPTSSPSCLPRPAQATTIGDGSFKLPLDPGSYVLRVRPADASRLPWVTQSLTVEPASGAGALVPAAPVMFTVPAPVYAGMQLLDPDGIPIVNAIVRAYPMSTPASPAPSSMAPAPAIELGEAITDVNGHFDLYLAPTGQ